MKKLIFKSNSNGHAVKCFLKKTFSFLFLFTWIIWLYFHIYAWTLFALHYSSLTDWLLKTKFHNLNWSTSQDKNEYCINNLCICVEMRCCCCCWKRKIFNKSPFERKAERMHKKWNRLRFLFFFFLSNF